MKIKLFYFAFFALLFISEIKLLSNTYQADTVYVNEIGEVPVIDGLMNDNCWSDAEWQAINYVWINYGEEMDSSDFTGKYKIVWSSEYNLLYVLVEIQDDAFVDGWPNEQGDYYHFDIVEIFIDQDKSGGLHVFDGTGQTGSDWGTNAENAFSYHINIDLPKEEEFTSECVVNDIDGTGWSDTQHPDYSNHFPEIALRENSGRYYWEFSLKVFDDSYNHNSPEDSRVTLKSDDNIGFTMAYCDNDGVDESPNTRDNFIGSVWVPEGEYNDHWMNADGYGNLKLVSNPVSVTNQIIIENYKLENNYPNPFNPSTNISFRIPESEHVTLKIYDLFGSEVTTLINEKVASGEHQIIWKGTNNNGNKLSSGIYYYKIISGNYSATKKMMLIK